MLRCRLRLCLLAIFASQSAGVYNSQCRGPDTFAKMFANITSRSNYDPKLRPSLHGWTNTTHSPPPELVLVNMYVTSINVIDQIARTLSFTGYARTWWTDVRLAFPNQGTDACYDHINIPADDWDQVWQPSVYFDNVITQTEGEDMLYLYSDGSIWKSVHTTLTISCNDM